MDGNTPPREVNDASNLFCHTNASASDCRNRRHVLPAGMCVCIYIYVSHISGGVPSGKSMKINNPTHKPIILSNLQWAIAKVLDPRCSRSGSATAARLQQPRRTSRWTKNFFRKAGGVGVSQIRGKYGEIADVFSNNGDWTHLQMRSTKHQNWGQKKLELRHHHQDSTQRS